MTQQAPQSNSRPSINTAAALGAVAIVIVTAIVLLTMSRNPNESAAARPSGSPSASAVATPTSGASGVASATPSPASTSAAPAAGVKPDAAHGLITFENIRSEIDPTGLQQPPEFSRSGTASFSVAVSPDGKRVAIIRGGQTGQQLVTFTTARPKDITLVLDFSASGEVAGEIVWAGDGSDFVVFSADRRSPTTIAYSAIRSVDLSAKKQSELARVTTGLHLMPLAWSFNSHIGGAVDVDSSSGRVSSYYVIRDNALTDRTVLSGSFNTQISASRDGKRIVAVSPPSLHWWPVDQPAAAKQLEADLSKGRAVFAAFRPGADELGVSVVAATVGSVPPPGHFEIWTLSGQQRVVSPTIGFSFWRVDGSAAIDGSLLVDPATGATTQLPGGAFKIADVVMF